MRNARLISAAILALAIVPVVVAAQSPRDSMVVSTSWLAEHQKDANLVLLHLGVKTDYDAGHIPGARFMTLTDIATTDTTSETGLTLQMPAAEDLRTRLQNLGISDNSRKLRAHSQRSPRPLAGSARTTASRSRSALSLETPGWRLRHFTGSLKTRRV